MKTAISIPDDVFAEADQLAQRLNRSRSRLYADAVREYVARRDADTITRALNEIYGSEDARSDAAVSLAARRTLERSEW